MAEPEVNEKSLKPNRTVQGGLVAALLSGLTGAGAALAVSCCAGPPLFMAVGLGLGGVTFFEKLAPYRGLFAVASVAMLIFAFWGLYLRKQPECETGCAAGPSKVSKIMFWITVVVVAASIIIPPALDAFMLKR